MNDQLIYTCKCCEITTDSQHKLTRHLKDAHNLSKREYYDAYLRVDGEGICPMCGNETTFRGSHYLRYCSHACSSASPEARARSSARAKGRKQSPETIRQRIANTDQKKKEATRQATMYERYDSLSTDDALNDAEKKEKYNKVSKYQKGSKHTAEHHRKVTETKIKNGTLKHKQETKDLIRKKLIDVYQSDNPPITVSANPKITKSINGKGHTHGYFNDIYYRSSYELVFLQQCFDRNIEVISADVAEFRIPYIDSNGKKRMYYPDFYLPKYDVLVEIKPGSMLDFGENQAKIDAACRLNVCGNFEVLTEEELFENHRWVDNLEHFLFEQ